MTATRRDAAMRHEDAEEYTAALGQVVAGGFRQIALGARLGVPQALGLSVGEWVQQRLGGYVKLSIPERREAVAELLGEGMTQRQVAEVLGVSHQTVGRDGPSGPRDDDASEDGMDGAGPDGPEAKLAELPVELRRREFERQRLEHDRERDLQDLEDLHAMVEGENRRPYPWRTWISSMRRDMRRASEYGIADGLLEDWDRKVLQELHDWSGHLLTKEPNRDIVSLRRRRKG
jgi:hypothetical protein